MPYWMVVAAVSVAGLAAVTGLLCRAVRKSCPYLVGRTPAGAALGRLAAVGRGTEIDIVEHDLHGLAEEPSWARVLAKWLKRGAAMRFLVQAKGRKGESVLRELAKGGGKVRLFVVRDAERRSDLVRDAKDFHFAVFRSPDQLWLEGSHPAGEAHARDCEYVSRASSDERWKPRREDFEALVEMSEEIALDRS